MTCLDYVGDYSDQAEDHEQVQRTEANKQSNFDATQIEQIVVTTAVLVGLREALSDGLSDEMDEHEEGVKFGRTVGSESSSAGRSDMLEVIVITLGAMTLSIMFASARLANKPVGKKEKERRKRRFWNDASSESSSCIASCRSRRATACRAI